MNSKNWKITTSIQWRKTTLTFLNSCRSIKACSMNLMKANPTFGSIKIFSVWISIHYNLVNNNDINKVLVKWNQIKIGTETWSFTMSYASYPLNETVEFWSHGKMIWRRGSFPDFPPNSLHCTNQQSWHTEQMWTLGLAPWQSVSIKYTTTFWNQQGLFLSPIYCCVFCFFTH